MERPKSFQWVGEPRAGVREKKTEKIRKNMQPKISRQRRRTGWTGWEWRVRRFRLRHIIFGLVLLLTVVATGLTLWISSLDIAKLAIPVTTPTQLMDVHGKPVSEISTVKNESIAIDQIPLSMRQAIVAVEDKRFYRHTGVDVPGILRASFRNARAGETAQGGSTITQQLAKNVFLSNEKTFTRKLTEAAYAFKIESSYDKDRILVMYLNQIYFGEGQWGIQRAANRYFGKNTKELTLAESALLAALPKAPSRYSPFKNLELAMERRNLVLGLMRQEGFISESEYKNAFSQPIRLANKKSDDHSLVGKFPSFADAVIDEAIERYGFTERQLVTGNLKIYTTVDPKVQEAMEETYRNDTLFPQSPDDQIVQSGAVILNPHTGGIRGIVGQRGEHVFRGFNHATQLKRQPGSAFKPIMVYAPALALGYTGHSRLYDGPLNINGYQPKNSDGRSHGEEVWLRDAVIHSWNVPAVWLLNEIGVSMGKTFVEKLGIPLEQEDQNLSLALGGLSKGVSPLQMAQAYSVFPAMGKTAEAHTILKITTADGEVLAEPVQESVQAMSANNAYTMTGILLDVVREGTGKRAALSGRPTAGKTGTTQLPDMREFDAANGGSKDAWFVGYTPELVGAVWLGYDNTDSKHYLTTSGGQYPAIIFKEMMTLALNGTPISYFDNPDFNNKAAEKNDKQNDKQNDNQNDNQSDVKKHKEKHKNRHQRREDN